jgi:hypothetical protein
MDVVTATNPSGVRSIVAHSGYLITSVYCYRVILALDIKCGIFSSVGENDIRISRGNEPGVKKKCP